MIVSIWWILFVMCSTISLWISFLNWRVFWKIHIQGVKAPSWIPLMGGLFGGIAMWILPSGDIRSWAWIPLLLDWGSLPGIGHSLLFHLFRKHR